MGDVACVGHVAGAKGRMRVFTIDLEEGKRRSANQVESFGGMRICFSLSMGNFSRSGKEKMWVGSDKRLLDRN